MDLLKIMEVKNQLIADAKAELEVKIDKINKDTTNLLNKASLSDFKLVSLEDLYKMLNSEKWDSKADIIKILESKKLEYRLEHGFVLYTSLNKLEISNDLKVKIEDRLVQARNEIRVPFKYFLEIKLSEVEKENKEQWINILNLLSKENECALQYVLKCKEEDCEGIIAKFDGRSVFWIDRILQDLKLYNESEDKKYFYKFYENLAKFTLEGDDECVCNECYEEVSIDTLYDDLVKLKEEMDVVIYSPSHRKPQDFYPVKRIKL